MKIVIISDTHRKDDLFYKVVKKEAPFDLLIHAGDTEGSETFFAQTPGVTGKMHYVAGNNDFFTDAPYDEIFYIGPHKVFLTHGHHYQVGISEERLLDEANAQNARIVIYGHTHRPVVREENGILVINPGSLGYPRQYGRVPSYAVLEVSDAPEFALSCEIRYL